MSGAGESESLSVRECLDEQYNWQCVKIGSPWARLKCMDCRERRTKLDDHFSAAHLHQGLNFFGQARPVACFSQELISPISRQSSNL